MIFHENRLPAEEILMKYHTLFVIFEKATKFDKIWNCHLLQIIGGALRFKVIKWYTVTPRNAEWTIKPSLYPMHGRFHREGSLKLYHMKKKGERPISMMVLKINIVCIHSWASWLCFSYNGCQGGQSRGQHDWGSRISLTSQIIHNFCNTESDFMR